jgi:hypothetical protein
MLWPHDSWQAGSLWTPLQNDNFDQCVSNLIGQIQAAIGIGTDAVEESVDDMREELQRLRDEDIKPVISLSSDGDDECPIPYVVPEASRGLVVSDSMRTLVGAVISPTSNPRCGFWGSGGIGKTTISAWLCRQPQVRRHFRLITWIALGQTPNIVTCQRSLYEQLTGSELPLDLSADEKLAKLRSAFAGKDCLVVLDDLWESEQIASFALIDERTKSKLLMSSRVRGVLESAEVVDISLPTEEEAIEIMIAAAAMTGPAPPEASEVVRMCKKLPLTLGIAGRMVKDLGLQNDWLEVTTMMKEEFSGDGDARSAEDSIIATSLRALKGPHAQSARSLLRAFRLIPEDVKCPLEALQCVFAASNGTELAQSGAGATPALLPMHKLRRITKMLIDRCLLLGACARCHVNVT